MNRVESNRRQLLTVSEIIALMNFATVYLLTGNQGMVCFMIAWLPFKLMCVMTADFVPQTLSSILRGRTQKGLLRNTRVICRNAKILQFLMGVIGTLLILTLASLIANHIFKMPYASFAMRILAPALLFRCINAAFVGEFHGNGSDSPLIMVAFLRPFFTLGFGLLFAYLLRSYGEKVSALLHNNDFTTMYAVAGFCIAVPLAEILLTSFLVILLAGSRRLQNPLPEGLRIRDDIFTTLRNLMFGLAPSVHKALLLGLPIAIGLYMKGRYPSASWEVGDFLGFYLLIGLVVVLVSRIILLPLIHKIQQTIRRDDTVLLGEMLGMGIHLAVVHFFFCFCMTTFLASALYPALTGKDAVLPATMLRMGSAMPFFAGICAFFIHILLLKGKKRVVTLMLITMNLVFAIAAFVLMRFLKGDAIAFVYAVLITSFVVLLLTGLILFKIIPPFLEPLRMLLIPAILSIICGVISMFLAKGLQSILGNFIGLLLTWLLALLLYWVGLLLCRSFQEQEFEKMLFGKWIQKLRRLLHL